MVKPAATLRTSQGRTNQGRGVTIMLRWLFSILIAAPFALLVVLFAVSNRETVTVKLFPLPFALDIPLYLAVTVTLALGVLSGAGLAWLMGHRARRIARLEGKRAQRLEKELAEVRAAALRPVGSNTPSPGKISVPALNG